MDDFPTIPVYRPLLPVAERLLPYLQHLDATRWYSNRGELVAQFERRLANNFGGGATVITAANGTAAIEAAILATAGRACTARPLALLPAYTFVATATAAQACGYTPYLVDVDAESWSLDAERLIDHPLLDRAGLVIAVAPYGRAIAQTSWRAFQQRSGVRVVIDAAAGIEGLFANAAQTVGEIPVALSFQATKSFSCGEGGAVVWSNLDGLMRVARALNFGMLYSRESTTAGLNGKLSEYHAAVGLACLDAWDATFKRNREVVDAYQTAAAKQGIADRLIVAPRVASNYAIFDAGSPRAGDELIAALQANRIESRRWYGYGLHKEPYWSDAARDPLPVTDHCAPALIGLPIAPDLSFEVIERITAVVARTMVGFVEH